MDVCIRDVFKLSVKLVGVGPVPVCSKSIWTLFVLIASLLYVVALHILKPSGFQHPVRLWL